MIIKQLMDDGSVNDSVVNSTVNIFNSNPSHSYTIPNNYLDRTSRNKIITITYNFITNNTYINDLQTLLNTTNTSVVALRIDGESKYLYKSSTSVDVVPNRVSIKRSERVTEVTIDGVMV